MQDPIYYFLIFSSTVFCT